MRSQSPSSGAARHLLPRGEKGDDCELSALSPSPLVGEGARRADEGAKTQSDPRLRNFARAMRHQPTEAERQLWLLLRNRRFANYKFRRQVLIGPYVADFVCYAVNLIVEADGSQHAENARDAKRDAELLGRGFRLLRLWNHDILARPEIVLDAVWNALEGAEMKR